MSCFFIVADEQVWNPSSSVGRLFHGQATHIAEVFGLDSGLGELTDDACQVDPQQFRKFVGRVVTTYDESNHLVLRSLLEPVALVGLVILHRADISVPEVQAGRRASWVEKRRSLGRTMQYGA